MSTRPESHARRVLLCVSGMTPQIVTETLQALLQQTPPFVPSEIRVVTTTRGRDRAQQQLCDAGHLAALCADHGLPMLPLEFMLIPGADGEPLEDIRDDADNTAAADCILATVRELAQGDDCAIHASLAGGRKTMSHYMGYALSLFGRPQDRLSHVLVAPEWAERAVDFHYVPKAPVELFDRNGNPLGRSDAVTVTLADIPLLRLGDALPPKLRTGQETFSEAVRLANLALTEPELVLDRSSRHIRASGIVIRLSPVQFAIFYWLASRVLRGLPGFQASCIDDEVLEDFLNSTSQAFEGGGKFTDSEADNLSFIDTARRLPEQSLEEREAYFARHRTKLGRHLKEQLGPTLVRTYLPGKGRNQPVALDLEPEQIRCERLAVTNFPPTEFPAT